MHRAPQVLRTYFTTFSTAARRRIFAVPAQAALFVETLMHYRVQGRFALHAFVVMPDHVHLLLTPAPEVSFEKALQFIRGGFSFRLHSREEVWERGHFDKRVPDLAAYETTLAYIHQNPVKGGLVASASGYAYSSASRMGEMDAMPDWLSVGRG